MTSEEYFNLYREKVKEHAELGKVASVYKKKIESLREQSSHLSREISKMKILMTIMIDQGIDPAEALLRYNADELPHNMNPGFWSIESSDVGVNYVLQYDSDLTGPISDQLECIYIKHAKDIK